MDYLASIQIPTFKEQEYIIRTLERLSKQSLWHRCEVIIGDYDPDGKGDTVNAVRTLGFPNVKCVDVGKSGIGYARGVAARHATAPYFVIFDADCYYNRDDAIELMLQPILNGETLITHCANILEQGAGATDWANFVFGVRNTTVQFIPVVYEQGLTMSKDTYDYIGGWPDVVQGEAPIMAANAVAKGLWNDFMFMKDVSVVVSDRRMGAFDMDYNYAWRNGKRVKVN